MNTQTATHYQIVLSFLGNTHNSYDPENFSTKEDAESYFLKEYKNRRTGDEYDTYWNNKPLVIRKITTITEVVTDERTPSQIAEPNVHCIDGKWKYLSNNHIWSAPFKTKEGCIGAFIENELS